MDAGRVIWYAIMVASVATSVAGAIISKKEMKLAKMNGLKQGLDMAYDAKHGTSRAKKEAF